MATFSIECRFTMRWMTIIRWLVSEPIRDHHLLRHWSTAVNTRQSPSLSAANCAGRCYALSAYHPIRIVHKVSNIQRKWMITSVLMTDLHAISLRYILSSYVPMGTHSFVHVPAFQSLQHSELEKIKLNVLSTMLQQFLTPSMIFCFGFGCSSSFLWPIRVVGTLD